MRTSLFQSLTDEEVEARTQDALAEQTRLKAEKLIKECGLPKRHLSPFIPEGEQWKNVETQLKARSGVGYIIALCGHRGTGKTRLAASCARETAFRGRSSIYKTAMEFFIDIKETFDGKRSEKEVIENYARPSLLILDEVQERGETAWEDRLLTHLIDRRYGAEKDTLLITNQTTEAFLQSIGESVSSRIQETGGIILCNWPSFRNKTNKTNP